MSFFKILESHTRRVSETESYAYHQAHRCH